MKTSSCVVMALISTVTALPGAVGPPTATDRGEHFIVVEPARTAGGMNGGYTLIGNGINRRNADGNWIECHPAVESRAGEIICTGTGYRVILSTNLNTPGAVDLETSDGSRIVSHPLGIGFYDPASGRSVLLAQIKDCPAEVVSNEIVFRDAFEGSGIEAAVTYRYRAGHFHQDITFTRRPAVAPADFGLGDQTRLEVLTEILDSPPPEITGHVFHREANATVRAGMIEPDLIDETLRFGGEMIMPPGRAFHSDGPAGHSVPVLKRLLNIEGRTVLAEAMEWRRARVELEKLPRASGGPGESKRQAGAKRQLPKSRLAESRSQPFGVRLALAQSQPQTEPAGATSRARAEEASRTAFSSAGLPRGLVWDYDLVQSGTNLTLQSGHTYLVTNDVLIDGLTLESGAVIKFTAGASLSVVTSLSSPTNGSKIVFTASDDDSAGSDIDGAPSTPQGRYAESALATYYLSSSNWNFLDVRYAETGLYCSGSTNDVSSCWFFECDTGVYAAASTISLSGVDWCGVDTWHDHDVSGQTTDIGSTECAADRDGDGLPDSWEQHYFGSLSQSGNGDFDGDGASNYLEWLLGRNPAVAGTTPDTGNTLKLQVYRPWQ